MKRLKAKREPQSAPKLQEKRFLKHWWWFDPVYAGEKSEAALAWETVRRLESYRVLWERFSQGSFPLPKRADQPTLAEHFSKLLKARLVRETIGQPYYDLIMKGFDPDRSWMELQTSQRLEVGGLAVRDGVAFMAHQDYQLPKQSPKRPDLSVRLVELDRDNSGKVAFVRDRAIGRRLLDVEDTEHFRNFGLIVPGKYVFVLFDTRFGRDAQLESFDAEMQRWLKTPLPVGDKKVDARYWAKISKDMERFSTRWKSDDGSPVEYWSPAMRGVDVRPRANEVCIIPCKEPPYAVLFLSARYNPAILRAAFHTRLKQPSFKRWFPKCVALWRTIEFNGRPVFDPKKHLPPKWRQARSAKRTNLWLGLAAHDVATSGIPLGYRSAEGDFLLNHSPSYKAVYNARSSAATRLAELNDELRRRCNDMESRIAEKPRT